MRRSESEAANQYLYTYGVTRRYDMKCLRSAFLSFIIIACLVRFSEGRGSWLLYGRNFSSIVRVEFKAQRRQWSHGQHTVVVI